MDGAPAEPLGVIDIEPLQTALFHVVTSEVYEFRRCVNEIIARIEATDIGSMVLHSTVSWPAPEEPTHVMTYVDPMKGVFVEIGLQFLNLCKSARIESRGHCVTISDGPDFCELVIGAFFYAIHVKYD